MRINCLVACCDTGGYNVLVPVLCDVTDTELSMGEHATLIQEAMRESGYQGTMVVLDMEDMEACEPTVFKALRGIDWNTALPLKVKSRIHEAPKPTVDSQTHSAYLIAICHPVTNVLLGAEIWSSPEWTQSRVLPERTFVAFRTYGNSYQAAKDSMLRQLDEPNFRYAWLKPWLDVPWRASNDKNVRVLNQLAQGG